MNKLLAQITILRVTLVSLLCKFYLGKDFTPLDIIPDEVACAESVTTLLKQAGMMPYVIAGTWTLEQYLMKNRNWAPVSDLRDLRAGDVVMSATGTSSKGKNAPFRGHVGILGHNGIIYANNSYTGKWQTTYDINTWRQRYVNEGGYPMNFYRYISAL